MKTGLHRSKRIVAPQNRSPHGWWIGSYLLRFEFFDEEKRRLNRRCKAWENTVLVKAKHREEAYNKVSAIGQAQHGMEFREDGTGRKGATLFEGLTMLLPVYGKLKDGAEVLWREYESVAVRTVKQIVRTKDRLEVFDDSMPTRGVAGLQ
jgi:hypothetical protein